MPTTVHEADQRRALSPHAAEHAHNPQNTAVREEEGAQDIRVFGLLHDILVQFANPYREEIESGLAEEAVSNFRKGFNSFLGLVFEMLSKDLLREYLAKRMSISWAGKWWRRDADVDLIIADDRAKRAVLCEVRVE